MKNFAEINKDNIVINIINAEDSFVQDNFIEYNNSNPAYIGGDYVAGYFYPPQPYASWVRNNGNWIAPIADPNPVENPIAYYWDEGLGNWVEA